MLVKRLSPESFFRRRAFPDQSRTNAWKPTDWILADLYDLTQAVAASQRENAKQPEPYPRPTSELFEKERRADSRRKALIDRYEARNSPADTNLTDGGDGA